MGSLSSGHIEQNETIIETRPNLQHLIPTVLSISLLGCKL